MNQLTTSLWGDESFTAVAVQNKLVPEYHDYIELTYTGSNLTTVDYKSGGSGGSTVASLALAYTGAQLDSVTKT